MLFQVKLDQPYASFSVSELKVIAFFAVFTAPVLEEIVFRGFFQSTLYRYVPPLVSVVLTSLIFMLFHVSYQEAPTAQLYVLCMGILFGWFRWQTNSVIPGILAHWVNNLLAAYPLFF
jgi:membrane protease YdiL (CAAX protease family)